MQAGEPRDEPFPRYRASAAPPPRVFQLSLGADGKRRIGLALLALVGSVGLSLALSGRLFLVLFGGVAPLLAYLLSGAPRRLEVHHDRVVVGFWLGRTLSLSAAELDVQALSDELVLVTPDVTLSIDLPLLGTELGACLEALRALRAG